MSTHTKGLTYILITAITPLLLSSIVVLTVSKLTDLYQLSNVTALTLATLGILPGIGLVVYWAYRKFDTLEVLPTAKPAKRKYTKRKLAAVKPLPTAGRSSDRSKRDTSKFTAEELRTIENSYVIYSATRKNKQAPMGRTLAELTDKLNKKLDKSKSLSSYMRALGKL